MAGSMARRVRGACRACPIGVAQDCAQRARRALDSVGYVDRFARWESSRPSHTFPESADFAGPRAEARIPWGFAGAGNRRPVVSSCVEANSGPGLQSPFPNFQNCPAAESADPVRFGRDRFDCRPKTETGRRERPFCVVFVSSAGRPVPAPPRIAAGTWRAM